MSDWSLATLTWDEQEIVALHRVIDSGQFTMGNEVQKFENAFCEHFGCKHAVMVNSGSSANLLMIAALFYTKSSPLQRGDEVIVPAVSWSTTYYPLLQYGLKLKFVDVDLTTLNYDIDALRRAISPSTRLVLAVNLLGNPNDFDALTELTSARGIRLVEDNCESMDAEFGGKKAGTFGSLGTFSTFFSHHISTMEGGVVVTDDEELFHILLALRAHGWTRQLPDKNLVCGDKSDDAFFESFRFVLPGYNVRPLEFSGAVGVEQLKKLPRMTLVRRANAERFRAALDDLPDFMMQHEIGSSSWFGFSIIIHPKATRSRAQVISQLKASGIECRPIVAGNFVRNEVMRYFDYSVSGDLRNADHVHNHGFFIGNHPFDISGSIASLPSLLAAS